MSAKGWPGVHRIEHPLIEHHLTVLRDKQTDSEGFRRALSTVATLMVYEATRWLETRSVGVRTPLGPMRGKRLRDEVILVPILRAGLGMLFPILDVIPGARVGFIGLKRNEISLAADAYHDSLPRSLRRHAVLLMDPMLATGGSALAALKLLEGRGARRVVLVNLLAAPEGIRAVRRQHPDLPIFTAAIDTKLNDKGYILPGLGDAGDRLFGV